MKPIGRQSMDHSVPEGASLSPENEVFFITICSLPRGENQLATPETWRVVEETIRVREDRGELKVRLLLAMPDHLHGLFEFPGIPDMTKSISSFKSWVAKQAGVKWQRGFFDHRIRSWESGVEKAKYIRQNPVRAGLIEHSEDWPYQR